MHLEEVVSGNINGKVYSGFFTLMPTGKYMASVVGNEIGENGAGEHFTKMCDNKEEAIAAVNEIWSELERSANQ